MQGVILVPNQCCHCFRAAQSGCVADAGACRLCACQHAEAVTGPPATCREDSHKQPLCTCIMSPACWAPASAMAPATRLGTTLPGDTSAKTPCRMSALT